MVESHQEDLKDRTKAFSLRVVRLYMSLPKHGAGQMMGMQLLRAATSIGAQYREAIRSRSRAEFLSKLQCCLQEAEESSYWMELLADAGILARKRLTPLMGEADELIAIFVASVRTTRRART